MSPLHSVDTGNCASVVAEYSEVLELGRLAHRGDHEDPWGPVRAAVPRFSDHSQPRIPTVFGYYDPTDLETHQRQFALAVRNGLHAFCYDLPWSPDDVRDEAFVECIAGRSDLDLSYCVALRPSGSLASRADWPAPRSLATTLVDRLSTFVSDERYLRRSGRPILVLRSWTTLGDVRELLDGIRTSFERLGIASPVLIGEAVGDGATPIDAGFELTTPGCKLDSGWFGKAPSAAGAASEVGGKVVDYARSMNAALARSEPGEEWIRAVVPSWDDSPVLGSRATVAVGASPDLFRAWLTRSLQYTYLENHPDHWVVFAGAWNAWRQGNYLEPDLDLGDARLRAVREATSSTGPLARDVIRALGEGSPLLAVAREYAVGAAALANQLLAREETLAVDALGGRASYQP